MTDIDTKAEREWWAQHGDKVTGTQAREKAEEYLGELEETHAIRVELEAQCSELSAELMQLCTRFAELEVALLLQRNDEKGLESEIKDLRAQLADQRARDIRMISAVRQLFAPIDVAHVADGYDRLASIPVPPPAKEGAK